MPERPPPPNLESWMNDVGRRLRDVERRPIQLPSGAEALQTFESGSPLGDTRFLDFGANLHATLTGDGYVRVDGTGGGPGGWDAIVDGTNGTSDPENRIFLGIGEALNYLRTTLGITQRAFVLVRAHPTSTLISNMPVGNGYQETATVTAPNFTYLFSSTPGAGNATIAPTDYPIWDHNGQTINVSAIFCTGIAIKGGAKSTLFTGSCILEDCFIDSSSGAGVAGRFQCATGDAYLYRCQMVNGWHAFTEAWDCDFRIFTAGSYNPGLTTSNGATRFVIHNCTIDSQALLSGAVTWNLTQTSTIILDLKLKRSTGGGGGNAWAINLTSGSGRAYLHNEGTVSPPSLTVTTGMQVVMDGYGWAATTIGAPGGSAHHKINIHSPAGTLDITGPATLQVATGATVTCRGSSISGFIATIKGGSSGTAVDFVAADQCALVIAGTPALPSGTLKPYAFDASSDNNTIIFTGTSLYPNAGTNAGTNNVVLPGAGSGSGLAPSTADYLVGTAQANLSAEIVVGTTPGGELGGTWAAPTVDTVHAGSAHLVAANAVVDEKTFGLASAVGVNTTESAREDHSHGTPGVIDVWMWG